MPKTLVLSNDTLDKLRAHFQDLFDSEECECEEKELDQCFYCRMEELYKEIFNG